MAKRVEGPTPAGGAYAVSMWLGTAGQEVDPADAVRAEIVEYDADGAVLQRTYLDDGHPAPWDHEPFAHHNDDLLIESQDGPKLGTWDLWHIDEAGVWQHPVRTLQELLQAAGLADADARAQRSAVAHLTSLPAWAPAPGELKAEVASWLESNRV